MLDPDILFCLKRVLQGHFFLNLNLNRNAKSKQRNIVCFPCKYVYEQYKGNENKLFESLASCSEY